MQQNKRPNIKSDKNIQVPNGIKESFQFLQDLLVEKGFLIEVLYTNYDYLILEISKERVISSKIIYINPHTEKNRNDLSDNKNNPIDYQKNIIINFLKTYQNEFYRILPYLKKVPINKTKNPSYYTKREFSNLSTQFYLVTEIVDKQKEQRRKRTKPNYIYVKLSYNEIIHNHKVSYNKIRIFYGIPFIRTIKTENRLNELTGKEWIKFTKSWFIHNPPRRDNNGIIHPAKFPESLAGEFITFFTKKNGWIIDPFAGVGSTLIAALEKNRNAVGLEINETFVKIGNTRIINYLNDRKMDNVNMFFNDNVFRAFKFEKECNEIFNIHADSRHLTEIWEKMDLPLCDFCITSPPYWNQLKRKYIRQKERLKNGLETDYGESPNNIGNIEDYDKFLDAQLEIFKEVDKVLKKNAYITVITNNIYTNGRLYPLAFDTLKTLSTLWTPKDEKIWCQDNKKLHPFGIYNAWVGNRCHQYCLIFRKE